MSVNSSDIDESAGLHSGSDHQTLYGTSANSLNIKKSFSQPKVALIMDRPEVTCATPPVPRWPSRHGHGGDC